MGRRKKSHRRRATSHKGELAAWEGVWHRWSLMLAWSRRTGIPLESLEPERFREIMIIEVMTEGLSYSRLCNELGLQIER